MSDTAATVLLTALALSMLLLAAVLACRAARHLRLAAPPGRPLTAGEVTLLQSVFGDALPFERIRVHNRKAYFFQPRDTAMAPDGHVYFPPEHHREDFSRATVAEQAWFVHEAAHLYQFHVLGWNVKLRGLLDRRYAYRLKPGRRFVDYGLEQQGAIAQDFHLLRQGACIRRPYCLSDYEGLLPPPAT